MCRIKALRETCLIKIIKIVRQDTVSLDRSLDGFKSFLNDLWVLLLCALIAVPW